MCLSWKCLFSMMSLKNRRFSLDSSVLEGAGVLSTRRSSNIKFSKKSNLDDARLEIQELNQSINTNMSLREQTIAEENLDRTDGLITSNSFLKYNKTFHKLFQEIPEGENLTHTFTCALQKEVLYHGKLFVSENYACFYSSVLLKDTKVLIPVSSVQDVKKQNSALSMLSIQTVDGEKYSFVSLRNREMCYKVLESLRSHTQEESANSSPRASSGENEADHDVLSSYSSLEDSGDRNPSRQNSIELDNNFPQLSSEAPTRCDSTRLSSSTDEDNSGVSWIWGILEGVAPFFSLQGTSNLSVLFHIYVILMVLLLLVSGYIGLKIIALEEQLNSLGALTEMSLQHRDYQET
ncbi:GRAM domain-containing protein 2B-like [Thunnus maccoyii]|uniref:GRAM domain-containing protein 2B-like n=1 Tax=Thunnus maccoyii TaxID=8240 RepID=UPI001C4C12DB|nr:GRAM domain-containing protein 2B-like [Thunnus maccoyii]